LTATRRRLRVTATLSSLSCVAEYAAQLASVAGLATADAYRLRLALDELFTNIAMHGGGRAEAGDLEIEMVGSADEGRVELEITDRCRPFDPVQGRRDRPRSGCRPSGEQLGGLGLVLLHQITDQLTYRRIGDENHTTLVVRAGSAAADFPNEGTPDGAGGVDRPGS